MTRSDDPQGASDPALTPTEAASGSDATLGAPAPVSTGAPGPLAGYRVGPLIGRGGMGEVVVARDERIGRDVAIKRMRVAGTSDAVARFLREARIQARLEHPAIVPVHEIAHDSEGQPYFTMKRIGGRTLGELLAASPPVSQQRLLRAFVDVCNAVEFAHSHAIVHRDLKPANVMLGDFGEVYVLDWGLARFVGEREAGSIASDVDSLDGGTQVGAVLGTPGYMAPEQLLGAADIGTAADIYALGSMLFEILTREPLHPRGGAALQSTLAPTAQSPSTRRPDGTIPPELDALCVEALARDPAARPTAAFLGVQVERYLDGDRDLERRRELAASWLVRARAALAADPVAGRAEAMRFAGRALALDPESAAAAELVTRLMIEPPPQLPAALAGELDRAEAAVQRRQSRVASVSFVAVGVFLAMLSWNGLRDGSLFAPVVALTAVMTAAALLLSRRHASVGEMMAVVAGNALLAALMSRAFGPLIVVPSLICVMAVSLSSYPQLIDRVRVIIAVLVASWLVPVLLEWTGVIAPTWGVDHGRVVSMSTMIVIGGRSTPAILVVVNVISIAVIALFANALARSRRDAQRQLEIQAWHLRQLLPPAIETAP